MSRVDVLGVQVDNVTKPEALERIRGFVLSGKPHYGVTVYSEFIVEAQGNLQYRQALNAADLSLADGVSVLWAARFLSLPKRGAAATAWAWLATLASVALAPQSVRTVIREKVTGSRLIWDIAEMAAREGFSIALAGGVGGVAPAVADKLRRKFPALRVTMAESDRPFDHAMAQRIAASNSDILLVAYQAPKQEFWIAQNLNQLNVKFAVGLGGTFDYVSGLRRESPAWMHHLGLEWLWRLVTQPWRARRIWRAVPVFSFLTLQHKLKQ